MGEKILKKKKEINKVKTALMIKLYLYLISRPFKFIPNIIHPEPIKGL